MQRQALVSRQIDRQTGKVIVVTCFLYYYYYLIFHFHFKVMFIVQAREFGVVYVFRDIIDQVSIQEILTLFCSKTLINRNSFGS